VAVVPDDERTGSYDNALAETINGIYKEEVIHREPFGNIPPAEAEARF
jgi:hypothetical protein